MRTAVIILGGLALLDLFALAGSQFGGDARGLALASIAFLAASLVIAVATARIGVGRAGYSLAEELPVFRGSRPPGTRSRGRRLEIGALK